MTLENCHVEIRGREGKILPAAQPNLSEVSKEAGQEFVLKLDPHLRARHFVRLVEFKTQFPFPDATFVH